MMRIDSVVYFASFAKNDDYHIFYVLLMCHHKLFALSHPTKEKKNQKINYLHYDYSKFYIEHFNRWLKFSEPQNCLFMLAQKQINLASLCAIDWNLIKSNFRQILILQSYFLGFYYGKYCIWYDSLILISKQKYQSDIMYRWSTLSKIYVSLSLSVSLAVVFVVATEFVV